jgi:colicin import membrane protein
MALRAGILSVLVHGVLLAVLLISFNWHAVQPASIAEVELWDSLPMPQPVIKPVVPEPAPEPPKPEPVLKPEPKPEPVPEPKAEIQIKKEKPKPKVLEKPKPDLAALAKEKEKQRQEEIRKLQEMVAADEQPVQDVQHKPAAVSADETSKYIGLVSAKIRPYVNKQLCGTGKPELIYEIAILPTGEIIGVPKLIKSSGIQACDEAVDRAIRQSSPLPRPSAELLAQFREFRLKFRPNDDN